MTKLDQLKNICHILETYGVDHRPATDLQKIIDGGGIELVKKFRLWGNEKAFEKLEHCDIIWAAIGEKFHESILGLDMTFDVGAFYLDDGSTCTCIRSNDIIGHNDSPLCLILGEL